MPPKVLPIEVQLTESDSSLGSYVLETSPVPGMEIILDGQSYLVMERRHRYTLNMNRYELARIVLLVKAIHTSVEKTWHDGQWVLGDMACQYNAQSPFIRCAVNPEGPCNSCPSFQAIEGSE